MFFIFTPTWGNDPIWRAKVSTRLVQPPTRSLYKLGRKFSSPEYEFSQPTNQGVEGCFTVVEICFFFGIPHASTGNRLLSNLPFFHSHYDANQVGVSKTQRQSPTPIEMRYWHGAGAVSYHTMSYMMDIIKYKWGVNKNRVRGQKKQFLHGIWPNEIFFENWIAMLAEMEAPPAGKLSKTPRVGYNMSNDFCQTSGLPGWYRPWSSRDLWVYLPVSGDEILPSYIGIIIRSQHMEPNEPPRIQWNVIGNVVASMIPVTTMTSPIISVLLNLKFNLHSRNFSIVVPLSNTW